MNRRPSARFRKMPRTAILAMAFCCIYILLLTCRCVAAGTELQSGDLAPPLPADPPPESAPQAESPFSDERLEGEDTETLGSVGVFVSAFCGGDETLAAAIKLVAEGKLRPLKGVRIVESMNEAGIILSFSGFRVPASDDQAPERIVYSFAFGTPDFEFVDDEFVSLPRYIYHEAVYSTKNELSTAVGANVQTVDEELLSLIRRD